MSIREGGNFRANESISAFRVVALNASTTSQLSLIELADTSTSIPIGIIQDNVSTNGSAEIIQAGYARASCGASVSAGSVLGWQTATGQVIELTLNTSTSLDRYIGIALQPGSTNAVIKVWVNPGYINIT